MAKDRILYGKKIVPHHMLTYAEQVYDILVGEIENGRWEVNDRLPGVMNLAKELGLGTKTVQTAYERLKNEGYLNTWDTRGSFLKAVYPEKRTGTIGVLAAASQADLPLILWYEHVIREVARRKGLAVVLRTPPDPIAREEVTLKEGLFGPDVSGVISLTPFRLPETPVEGAPLLPWVFLCPPYEPCTPKVCADVREAYYQLTCRAIRLGHRRIVFSEDSVEPDPRQTELHREGYLEAMSEHRLPVEHEMMAASRAVDNSDSTAVARYLDGLMQPPPGQRPTMVIAGSLGRSMALVRIAPLRGVSIPDDVSVASIGSDYLDKKKKRQVTGMLPDFNHMVELCLSVLDHQRDGGPCPYTSLYVRMHVLPGHTLAGRGRARTHPADATRGDLQTLSQAVHF